MLNPRHKLYRWGPISACPLFLYFAIEPAFAPLKKLFGITYSESLIIFRNGKGEWFLDDNELAVESRKFAAAVILHPMVRKQFNQLWIKRTDILTKHFSRIDRIDFHTLTKKDLVKLFRLFSNSYYYWFMITISLELISSSLEPLLGDRLKKYFKKADEIEFQKAFSVLSAPTTLTFYRREQRDMLSILKHTKDKWLDSIREHQKKYYWILNSYAQGNPLSIEYFFKELMKLSKTNWQSTLKEIETYPKKIVQDKKHVFKAINPSLNDLKVIETVEHLADLMDKRKEYNFRSDYYLELFVREFGKRSNYSIDDLKYLLPEELSQVLDGTDFSEEIVRRKQCYVFVCTAHAIESFNGDNAIVIADQFTHVNQLNESVIHGRVASTGDQYYFRGIAKIVHTVEEIGKVQKGDILIAPMTSPDYVIGMKKAGAIITDVGGILSHAAIVSREFRIPCIVGTEIATKVIHDGDIVELHCGKGTVRIIKHGK